MPNGTAPHSPAMTARRWRAPSTTSPTAPAAAGLAVAPATTPSCFDAADRRPRRAPARKCATCACTSTARSKRACSRSTASCSAASTKATWPPETRSDPWLSRPMRRAARPRSAGAAHRPVRARLRAGARRAGSRSCRARAEARRRADGDLALRAAHRRARRQGRWKTVCERGEHYLALARALDEPAAGASRRRGRRRSRRSRRGRRGSRSPRSRTGCAIPTRSTPSTSCACSRSIRSTRRPARATAAPSSTAPSAISRECSPRRCRPIRSRNCSTLGEKHFAPLDRLSGGARVLVAALRAHRALVRAMGAAAARRRCTALHAEIRGELKFPLGAARVHAVRPSPTASSALSDGSYAILDYKTGQARTEKQVRTGLAPQLTLEAAILRAGGFRHHRRPARCRDRLRHAARRRAGRRAHARSTSRTARPTRKPTHALARLKALAAEFENADDALSTRSCIRCGRRITATTTISRA